MQRSATYILLNSQMNPGKGLQLAAQNLATLIKANTQLRNSVDSAINLDFWAALANEVWPRTVIETFPCRAPTGDTYKCRGEICEQL